MEPQTYWDMFWGYAAIWGLLAAFIIKMQITQSLIRILNEPDVAKIPKISGPDIWGIRSNSRGVLYDLLTSRVPE